MTDFVWDDDRVKQLLFLVTEEGRSFSQIARTMGCSSRNAPLCKFNRLKEKDPTLKCKNAGPNRVRNRIISAQMKVAKVSMAPPPPPSEIVPAQIGEAMVTIENVGYNMCRYPHGDPASPSFYFCGNEQKKDSSYCATHHKMCRTPNEPRKRAA